jgi:hypothetical protein
MLMRAAKLARHQAGIGTSTQAKTKDARQFQPSQRQRENEAAERMMRKTMRGIDRVNING